VNSSCVRLMCPHCSTSICPDKCRGFQPASFRVLACVILLLSMLGVEQLSAQDDASDNSSKKTVQGTVVNSVTREPVSRALVFSPDHRLATMTDEQGHFELTLPQPTEGAAGNAQFAIAVSNYSGILIAFRPGFLDPQHNPTANHVTSNEKEFTIAIVPEALIIGRVVLPPNTGDRIEVNLYRRLITEGRAHWYPAGEQQSRSNGEFRFFGLEPGTYKLLTSEMMDRDPLTSAPGGPMYGYPPAYFTHAVNFATAQAIQLKTGMTFQAELTPVRQRYYPVDLPVTNGPHTGQVEVVEVSVSMQGGKGPGYALGYDSRHQKISGSLPNGNYVVEAFTEGENPASGSMNIEVKGAAVQGPVMTLVPNGSVGVNAKLEFKTNPDTGAQPQGAGEITFSDGRMQSQNFNVRLEPADDFNQGNPSQTRPPHGPSDESVILEHVRPGRYWVRIDSPRGFAASVTAGDTDLLRHPLTVRAGTNLVVDVVMRDDGAEIAGTVEGLQPVPADGSGTALRSYTSTMRFAPGTAQAHVYCLPLPDSTGQLREVWVGPDGRFSLPQMPPGGYRLLAFEQPQRQFEYLDPAAMEAYEGKGRVVQLRAGQKEDVKLQIIPDSE
jgi:hypothetical protein